MMQSNIDDQRLHREWIQKCRQIEKIDGHYDKEA